MSPSQAARAAILGGFVAGTLDISAAFLVYGLRGAGAIRILQGIASGLLGSAAFRGGAATVVLGLALHFLIAIVAAAVYCAASLRIPALSGQPGLFGPLYGVVVYVFMNFVVVPLSATRKYPFSLPLAAIILVVHVVCIGMPIAYTVRRFSRASA